MKRAPKSNCPKKISETPAKGLLSSLIVIGFVCHSGIYAQMPDPELASDPESIYGVYIGELAFIEPISQGGPYVYPFTPEGELRFRGYDPNFDDPKQLDDCEPDAMPAYLLTDVVANMELSGDGKNILMRFERDNAVRVIHMEDSPAPTSQENTRLGYSKGRWKDNVLTIETTHLLDGVIFAQRAYPMSTAVRISERYWRKPGERNLQMDLVVHDPIHYTESVTMEREWVWRPDEQIHPWECVHLGSRDEPLDLDTLRRKLEQL